ncbi:MAG: hypothetical protein HY922_09430 [Elusimicrobia bacterium]|nr:hypothetical protein [Elusimicrobiota bacterium]
MAVALLRRLPLALSILFCIWAFGGSDSLFPAERTASADSLEQAASAINGTGSAKKSPKHLVLSSLLPVIADGQALIIKVAEARRIIPQLDKETLAGKLKLPTLTGVFEPIHLGLAKPAKPGEYGGGMSPRLEFIEKNLAKSFQDIAKLPSACDAAHQAQWKAAIEG